MRPHEIHRTAQRTVRFRPAWWLRRVEHRILARGRPTESEVARLGAIRRELATRGRR